MKNRSDNISDSPLAAEAWRVLAWIGVALITVILALTWIDGNSAMAWPLGIFLVAGLFIMRLKNLLPSFFLFLLVLSALLNGAGGAFEWFEGYVWFDELVHLYTGFAGLAAIGYLYAREKVIPRAKLVWWCTGMGLALGIGWEVVEGLGGDLEMGDTISDVVLDTIGAAFGGLFAWYALRATRGERRALLRGAGGDAAASGSGSSSN